MECVFIGYCDNGRIKTSGVSVKNSSGASGWIKKKTISSNGIFCYIFFAFHYSVETPVREKAIKSEKLIQPLCRMPVSLCRGWLKMEDSSGGQHICLWFDWDLIANFWLMSGKGSPNLSISTVLAVCPQNLNFWYFLQSLHSVQLNKAIKTFCFLPLHWRRVSTDTWQKMTERSNFKRQMRGGIQSPRTSFLPLLLPGVHIS